MAIEMEMRAASYFVVFNIEGSILVDAHQDDGRDASGDGQQQGRDVAQDRADLGHQLHDEGDHAQQDGELHEQRRAGDVRGVLWITPIILILIGIAKFNRDRIPSTQLVEDSYADEPRELPERRTSV